MIRRFQALNYRCLRHADVSLGRFHLLTGANSSGKSTLFDAISFVSDLVRDGLSSAVERRTGDFRDLVFGRKEGGSGFELALEFDIPVAIAEMLPLESEFRRFRYEVSIRDGDQGPGIEFERGVLLPTEESTLEPRQSPLFPLPPATAATIISRQRTRGSRTIFKKSTTGVDSIYSEVAERSGKGWIVNNSYGRLRSTFGSLPDAPSMFPIATHVRQFLERHAIVVGPDIDSLRAPSPPGRRLADDMSDSDNLPWLIRRLQAQDPVAFDEWLDLVRSTEKDLQSIDVIERADDRHACIVIRHASGFSIPARGASAGLLRFMAMTLLPHQASKDQLFMIEELERGFHPSSLEAVQDVLTKAEGCQILASTHSPAAIDRASPESVLNFVVDDDGTTRIEQGCDFPSRKDSNTDQ